MKDVGTNTILSERNIKLRERKSNACKWNIILRERNIIFEGMKK